MHATWSECEDWCWNKADCAGFQITNLITTPLVSGDWSVEWAIQFGSSKNDALRAMTAVTESARACIYYLS